MTGGVAVSCGFGKVRTMSEEATVARSKRLRDPVPRAAGAAVVRATRIGDTGRHGAHARRAATT